MRSARAIQGKPQFHKNHRKGYDEKRRGELQQILAAIFLGLLIALYMAFTYL